MQQPGNKNSVFKKNTSAWADGDLRLLCFTVGYGARLKLTFAIVTTSGLYANLESHVITQAACQHIKTPRGLVWLQTQRRTRRSEGRPKREGWGARGGEAHSHGVGRG